MAEGNPVSERLQSFLLEQGLRPGDRLPPERRLAVQLGISRAGLREALRRLIDLGVLEARRGSGTYLTEVDLSDLLEVRLRLEPYAARLAARRRTEHDLRLFDDLLETLRATENDPPAFAAVDARLHEAIVAAAASPTLRTLIDALADLLRYSRAQTAPDAGLRGTVLQDLEVLIQALHQQDSQAAERAMRVHLRAVVSKLASGDGGG